MVWGTPWEERAWGCPRDPRGGLHPPPLPRPPVLPFVGRNPPSPPLWQGPGQGGMPRGTQLPSRWALTIGPPGPVSWVPWVQRERCHQRRRAGPELGPGAPRQQPTGHFPPLFVRVPFAHGSPWRWPQSWSQRQSITRTSSCWAPVSLQSCHPPLPQGPAEVRCLPLGGQPQAWQCLRPQASGIVTPHSRAPSTPMTSLLGQVYIRKSRRGKDPLLFPFQSSLHMKSRSTRGTSKVSPCPAEGSSSGKTQAGTPPWCLPHI